MTGPAESGVAGGSRLVERLLLAAGVVLLGSYCYVTAEAWLYQRAENRALDALLTRPLDESAQTPPLQTAAAVLETGTVLGRLEIPRLGVSTIVRAGTDARTLRLAIGHVPGTALPGQVGNIGLAAHRDTFFSRLGDIRTDDEVRLVTPTATYVYSVERTHVVAPDDVWVLDPTASPALTLVTCYPFTYVGDAPERFIVRAGIRRSARAERSRPFKTLTF